MTDRNLIRLAAEARLRAYAPYSDYQVGAALLTASGTVYTGCNIENASYGATNCAERTAFFKAVEAGERDFSAIAVVGGKAGEPFSFAPPCGICRQVMQEFCAPSFRILLADEGGECREYTLAELFPVAFEL